MIEFEIKNMTCGHCVRAVSEAVKQVDPAADVQIDLASKKVSVASSKERTSFAEALTEAGYATA